MNVVQGNKSFAEEFDIVRFGDAEQFMSEVYFQFEKIVVQKYVDKNSLQEISRMELPAVEKILQIMALTTGVHNPIPF